MTALRAWLAVSLILLAGCGFQLRGSAQLPFASVSLNLPAGDPLGRELASVFRANEVSVAPKAAGVAAIDIQRNNLVRRIQSVGANARVREFELHYDLTFALTSAAGEVLIPATEIALRRDYSFDQAEVLGAASEEEYLRGEMVREMAARIVQVIDLAQR